MHHLIQFSARRSLFVLLFSTFISLVGQTGWAGDKSRGSTLDLLVNEECNGKCNDGYYAHRVKVITDNDNICGPIAAAAVLADLGCETLQGPFKAKTTLPWYGTTPGHLADMINDHIDKGDSCYRVEYASWTFKNRRQYFNTLQTLTREKGYPVAALVKQGTDKYWLHWVVVGDVGPTQDHSCAVTYYDDGHRRQVRCSAFSQWASRGYVEPFVSPYTAVVPRRNRS